MGNIELQPLVEMTLEERMNKAISNLQKTLSGEIKSQCPDDLDQTLTFKTAREFHEWTINLLTNLLNSKYW
jgi:hypothetical protein